ncbi:hypothetical protein FXF68_31010 [Actinomadura decatromicini]|uniref:Uncharacterized protein n=2 Tax=Actinomadura decatromicini TaxID=2604572 RepID=A0A5D3FCR0_9ACTN|nr:hypothetical protein FXF68_31010 [Actinomadura decatromicini]
MTALDPGVRELLAAIRDMLALPYPSDADPADRVKRNDLLDMRRSLVVGTLNALVDRDADSHMVEAAAQTLREDLDQRPPTYVTEDGEADR